MGARPRERERERERHGVEGSRRASGTREKEVDVRELSFCRTSRYVSPSLFFGYGAATVFLVHLPSPTKALLPRMTPTATQQQQQQQQQQQPPPPSPSPRTDNPRHPRSPPHCPWPPAPPGRSIRFSLLLHLMSSTSGLPRVTLRHPRISEISSSPSAPSSSPSSPSSTSSPSPSSPYPFTIAPRTRTHTPLPPPTTIRPLISFNI
jgi:hypothetical protein